jgi:hypothetical protein
MKTCLALLLSLGFIVGTASCSARRIRTPSLSHELLFPLGVYNHNVQIKTLSGTAEESKTFSFKGVVKISSEDIKISGLSAFGTTLFKFSEDRSSGKVEFTNYLEALKKHEAKFRDYYSILKLLLVAPRTLTAKDGLRLVREKDGLPEEFETLGLEPKAVFIFKKYDGNGIPEEIEIQHPNFLISIRVSGYDV